MMVLPLVTGDKLCMRVYRWPGKKEILYNVISCVIIWFFFNVYYKFFSLGSAFLSPVRVYTQPNSEIIREKTHNHDEEEFTRYPVGGHADHVIP